jgi:hypothetical protein
MAQMNPYYYDMYDHIARTSGQYVLQVPAAQGKPPAQKPKMTPEQLRRKEVLEYEEVREWWYDLPEEKKQKIREEQFPVAPKKKKKEKKKEKPKESEPAPEDEYITLTWDNNYKSWDNYKGPSQQWGPAIM